MGAGLAALILAGCAPGQAIDRVPEAMGGLPAGTPARPTATYQYPAVHDMPPPRDTKPLSEEDQVKLEKDLQSIRDGQESRQGQGQTGSADAKEAKKKPAASKTGQNTGAKTNP